jgi:hypothetical protein
MAVPLIVAGLAAAAKIAAKNYAKDLAKKTATREVGGITGAGAKQVAPVYREMGTGSVKVLPNATIGLVIKDGVVTKNVKQETIKNINQMTTSGKKFVKSGNVAKVKAQAREGENLLIPKKPTIKINSNPMRGK